MNYDEATTLAEELHECETVDDEVVLVQIGARSATIHEWEDKFDPTADARFEAEFYSTNDRVLAPEVMEILSDADVSVYAAAGDDYFRTRDK